MEIENKEEPTGTPGADELFKQSEERLGSLEGRIDAIQDSIDTLVEEVSLKGRPTPEAEPEEEPKEEPEGEPKEPELEEPKGKPENIEEDIDKAIKEDDEWRRGMEERTEEILIKEEMRDMQHDWNEALKVFPEANKKNVFLEIEDGSEESVLDLAKKSHEAIAASHQKIREEAETGVKEQLKKEGEGSLNLPQSSGPASPAPQGQGKPEQGLESDAWGEASQAAKKDLGQ